MIDAVKLSKRKADNPSGKSDTFDMGVRLVEAERHESLCMISQKMLAKMRFRPAPDQRNQVIDHFPVLIGQGQISEVAGKPYSGSSIAPPKPVAEKTVATRAAGERDGCIVIKSKPWKSRGRQRTGADGLQRFTPQRDV
jgi:hypothetical protein